MTTFLQCLREAAHNKALIAEYDRLNGTNLSMQGSHLDLAIDEASGRQSKEIEGFVGFVYDCIYLRLPDTEAGGVARSHDRTTARAGQAEVADE